MQINKYQILLQIVDNGSIKKASESLGYTQSAVSQALKSTEDEFGIKVLVRKKNGIRLTSEGEQIMPYVRSICNTESYLHQKIDSLKGVFAGNISIGAYHSVAATILPQMIKEFNELHPKIRFHIYEGDFFDIEDWIHDGKVDFGFLSIDEFKQFQTIPLVEDPMVAVVSPESVDARKELFDINLFNDREVIALNEHRDRELFRIFRNNGIKTITKYEVEEYETVIGMVANGLGIGLLPAMSVKDSDNVVCIPTDPYYYRRIGIVLRDLDRAPSAVRAFVDYAEKRYR